MKPVSVVASMRNSETTILQSLESICKQKYPIREIIVIDNKSSDSSVELVFKFRKKSTIPIQVIKRGENKGVSANYNLGVRRAISEYVIFIHSDSSLPSEHEIEKLTKPLRMGSDIVASYPKIILPEDVWDRYNFWQKCLFSRSVGKESPGFNGKFDCVRKDIFLKIGGFSEFLGGSLGIGGEDADLYLRLQNEGDIVLSHAKVIHLHYLGSNYSISDWIKNRKLLARTYGRLIRFEGRRLPLRAHGKGLLIPLGILSFMIRPTLAVLPFIPNLHLFGVVLLIIYAFVNSKKMYTTVSTLRDSRIFLLPFIDVFLVYYETFWMLEAFFLGRRRV